MDHAALHPLTLRFASPDREASFRRDYYRKSVRLVRLAILLGCGQYALFGFLDAVMIPDSLAEVRVIRVVVCSLLLVLLGVTYTRAFTARTMQRIVSLVPLVAGIGAAVLAYVGQDPNGYYDYYAGLMLILFYVHALLRLRFVYATAVSWAIIGIYYLVTLLLIPTPLHVLTNNAFFLASANTSGMVASYALEFYARKLFAKNQVLDEQNRVLTAEHARKSAELDASRQLQISLLPRALPALPHADLAVHMETATEVGGDYYDVDLAEDGTLTFAIGDATGHGAEAGVMVTATKMFFACRSADDDLHEILSHASGPMKRIGQGRLFMALALGRLRGDTLELAGAGMPHALIHRAATNTVESVPLKGMPLGGFADYPYTTQALRLDPGDTVVLMSDGFPELFNDAGEMLGYGEVEAHVRAGIAGSADALIAHLRRVMADWNGGHPLRDDVTFLVLQMKPELAPSDAARPLPRQLSHVPA
ncbi:MAG: PP2C family protein-serine/threonine phosphatase [Rhodothermales bacterium]